ncbi:MAG: hypothetical protein LBF61_00835 [Azoarcus sp.]|jgi:hypothetical protein|nr:hypothetical protein [Azoarcus sp.]
MPVVKPLIIGTDGTPQEYTPLTESAGASSSGEIPALDASGRLPSTMLPEGVGSDAIAVQASEALTGGAFVNLWADGGNIRVRLADNSNNRPADGFVLTAAAANTSVLVYPFGEINSASTGLTVGTEYFLGAAGQVTASVPTAAGAIIQKLGKSRSATELLTRSYPPIRRAS